eukprot:scaffold65440_cov30-Tisochrysis_lutea.AAC.2
MLGPGYVPSVAERISVPKFSRASRVVLRRALLEGKGVEAERWPVGEASGVDLGTRATRPDACAR